MPRSRKQREQATRRDIDRAEIRGFVLGMLLATLIALTFL